VTRQQAFARRLLRLKPGAAYLSMSVGSLRARIQRGELPAVVTGEGAPWLVDIKDLDDWIDKNKTRL